MKKFSVPIILSLPLGIMLGATAGVFFNLLRDFGWSQLISNIRLQPQAFLDQYLSVILIINLLTAVVLAVLLGANLFRHLQEKAKI